MSVSARKRAPARSIRSAPPRRASRADTRTVPIRHVTLPFATTATETAQAGETIGAFLARTKWATPLDSRWAFQLPTILVINGRPVIQRFWKRRRIKVGDVVEFWSRPWGKSGGGRNTGKLVVGIVALIALAAFAPWAGGLLAGALGIGALGASIASSAILMGGALLIQALTNPKTGGQSDDTNDQVQRLNSVSAAGNTARLLQPIPVQYGRIKSFPDYAITPWSEFIGNDQYLNVLLSIGLGKHEYETLYIDDTILWTDVDGVSDAFGGVAVAFYDPDESVTLFPTNVVQSSEVSGQTLPSPSLGDPWIGGFIVNSAGTSASDIAVDLVFPAGAWLENSDGMHTVPVSVRAEYRPVDNAGAPTGSYATLFDQTFSYQTRNPERVTVKTVVIPGRYEVRVRRLDEDFQDGAFAQGYSGANTVVWVGLRAFIQGPSQFPVSTVALRIKATSQLTETSARRFGVLCTRVLDVWDGSTFVPTATRNPWWAVWNAATDADYGIKRPPSKIDFQTVVDQATAADTRGDKFDFRFNAAVAAPEALDTILRGARSRHRWSGDVLTFVRDEWATVPRMLLTDREIVRGTLSLEYSLNVDDSADAVTVEYVDEQTWGQADVQYPPNSMSFTAVNPSRIRVDGIVNRDHAYREAAFYYLQSQLRRVSISLDTEHDGRMLGYGSRVRVQTELPLSWGSTGAVVGRSSNTLTVDPAPTWAATGSHYIAIRTKTGRQFGPVLCTQGVDTAHIVLNSGDLSTVETAQGMTLTDALARADGADDPSFDFGPGENRARDCIVMSGRPARDRVTLGLVVDNIDVHETSLDAVPAAPTVPALRDPKAPVISGLYASFRQGVAEPILEASWFPAAGAVYYVAWVSYDSGASWLQIYEGSEPKFSAVVDRASLRVRAQGVGIRQGAFAVTDVAAPTIEIAPGTVSTDSMQSGLRDYVTNEFKSVTESLRNLSQLIASVAGDQDAANWLDKKETRRLLSVTRDQLTASIESVETVAVSTSAAFAEFQMTVTAQYGSLTAFVSQTAVAVAKVDGTAGALYTLSVNVGGKISGFKLGNDGVTGNFEIEADVFAVGKTGTTGGSFVPVFTVANVGGTPKLTLRGDMIADGTIIASKIQAATITTNEISVGGVDLQNLVDGAATKIAITTGSNVSFTFATTTYTLVSTSFTTAVGRVAIDASVELTPIAVILASAGSNVYMDLSIYVDAVLQKTVRYQTNFVGGSSWLASGVYSFPFLVTGLSAGSHTFELKAVTGSEMTGANIKAPVLRLTEVRR